MSEFIGIRCAWCGRAGLPAVPNQKLGAGELTTPVAHVHSPEGTRLRLFDSVEPCMQGLSPSFLEKCVPPGELAELVAELHETIWTDDALWEL